MSTFEIERMTRKAEDFFQEDFLPKERFSTVVLKDGEISAGHCYYQDTQTGVWGVYFKLADRNDKAWCDDKTLAQCIRFPFEYLGVRMILSKFSSPLVRYYIERIGAKVREIGNGQYEGYVLREDGLACAEMLEKGNAE